MPIVTDPDNLDRDQLIFNTNNQKLSIYPVGAYRHANASTQTASTLAANPTAFRDGAATFTTWGVVPGDVIILRNGPNAAHHVVSAVISETEIAVETNDGFTAFANASALTYAIASAGGGSAADGITKQAIYSFSKEEWRSDGLATMLSDNLIRHEFPFEPITSEQFEIGGGAQHADWAYWNDYSRKKSRTGGWSAKNTAASTLAEYGGFLSLGSLDTDTQAYYQQVSAGATPVDFDFLGTINEPVLIYTSAGDDRRAYFKAFARKKYRSYAEYDLNTEQSISALTYKLYSFPLAHATDTAITATDAAILGTSPFRVTASTVVAVGGSTTAGGVRFQDASATFTASNVAAGDTLQLKSGAESGSNFTITSVGVSTLQIGTDADFAGFASTESNLSYATKSIFIVASTGAGIAGTLTAMALAAGASAGVALASVTGETFISKGVAVNDILEIASATSDHEGMYVITSVISETTLQVDATDNDFTVVTGVDYRVREQGMYLQYKNESITIGAMASVTFDAINAAYSSAPTIKRGTGSWVSDGVTEGSIVTFASTTNNNLSFTVASTVTASTITCVLTDGTRMTDEVSASATVTGYDAFKRAISGVTYAFKWKLIGNGASALNLFQFHQHQMRQTTDIDWGEGDSRGDITSLLMTFASPTGTTIDMIIDNIDADDTNNMTYADATEVSRSFPFVSSMTINFNTNLQGDANAVYRMFFTTNPAGDYSTSNAVTVQDDTLTDIAGNVGGSPSVSKTFDYDGNVQGGRSAGTDADITLVAIGLSTAQFVSITGTITRTKGLSFSLPSALERNYTT